MAGEPLITIIGNATGDAELRFTPSGAAVATFNVAVTPRVKKGDQWTDGDTTFFRCSVWREMAEQVAETVTKGMRLIVHGRFKTRQWEKDGQTRTSVEIDVDEVGPSLRYATAKVQKMARSSGSGGFGNSGSGQADDPWATSAPSGPTRGSFNDDEAPF
ncbi:single-stranded DNA-binding protein [Polymorphospora lycopeni]|uniref:Single-stranded DNA-binding protein n=1 Tax=Polymorphospora lycopeni TaxID=3140240 RepID=A0ABV5CP61_9ACTN